MRLAILGTGSVGRTLAGGCSRAGYDVVVGTRDPDVTAARAEWADAGVALASYAEATDSGDVVVNALNGLVSLDVLGGVGDALAGKVLLDVANALDFSGGFPPTLAITDPDSLAEQIQRAHPEARVVKALNTVTAAVMVDPASVGDGDTTIFLAGDDAEARATVRELLVALGWRDIVEFEALSAARGLEMWMPLWVRLMQVLGTPQFNLRIVR